MNKDTGELRRLSGLEQAELDRIEGGPFTHVPKEHEAEANRILGDKDRAFADMSKDTPLINWAKGQQGRMRPKNSKRAKMAKASRKRNRKG